MGRRGILLAQRIDWNHTAERAYRALEPLLEESAEPSLGEV